VQLESLRHATHAPATVSQTLPDRHGLVDEQPSTHAPLALQIFPGSQSAELAHCTQLFELMLQLVPGAQLGWSAAQPGTHIFIGLQMVPVPQSALVAQSTHAPEAKSHCLPGGQVGVACEQPGVQVPVRHSSPLLQSLVPRHAMHLPAVRSHFGVAPLQSVSAAHWHAGPTQVHWPARHFLPVSQVLPAHAASMQLPPAHTKPGSHVVEPHWVEKQLPSAQVVPAAHAWPHMPQLALSVCVSTHAVPHVARPGLHAHAPAAQLWLGGQMTPTQALSVQVSCTQTWPALHIDAMPQLVGTHLALAQAVPPEHTAPQPPQLLSSSLGSEHLPPQSTRPVVQLGPGTGGLFPQADSKTTVARTVSRLIMWAAPLG
jgi:hypothetical protein